MEEKELHDYYFGNLPKNASQHALRCLLAEYGEVTSFEFRLENRPYFPTKIALITFAKALEDEALVKLNATMFDEKRLFVCSTKSEKYFTPLLSIVVRYLNEHITEEDIYDHFSSIGSVELVQKPAHNYAYVSFQDNVSIKHAFEMQRTLKGVVPYIVAVKRKISVFLETRQVHLYESIKEKCDKLDLIYDPASENETTMLVTNIPRDTEEDDVIDFLGTFGKIVDWEMMKSSICVMSNEGYVTYQHPRKARNLFKNGPLNFQGCGLDVYNQKLMYSSKDSNRSVVIRRTSVYLTNDEIFEKFTEFGKVEYIQRIDAVNYNTIVRLDSEKTAEKVLCIPSIAGESVQIRLYSVNQYMLATSAPTKTEVPPKRSRKESMLKQIIEIEEQKNLELLPTQLNRQYCNPNPECYRNEVQIWNYDPKLGLVPFQEYFIKYGTVTNLRVVKEHNSSSLGVVYLSFETKLEAKRVCKLNHSFMFSRRLLIFMGDHCIVHDPMLCVRISNLSEEVADEDIHDRFSMIGHVKYVFRPRVEEAIVCMAKEKWQQRALKVICVGRFFVIVTSLLSPINQHGSDVPNTLPCSIPSESNMDVNVMTRTVPTGIDLRSGMMHGASMPGGPISQPLSMPQTPMMGPGISASMLGATPICPIDTIQMGGLQITPRMRGLMQAIEREMNKSYNFTSMPMADQYYLVRDIINQCMNFPDFLSLNADQKISYLIHGQNGFQYVSSFTLFTYPEQLQMLSIIEAYYRGSCAPGISPITDIATGSANSSCTHPNMLAVPIQQWEETSARVTSSGDKDEEDDSSIPPAPSPPPISFHSNSASPVSDDVGSPNCLSSDDSKQKRKFLGLDEGPPNKRTKNPGNMHQSQKPLVYVSNLPNEVTEKYIKQIFLRYGKIKFISQPTSLNPEVKAVIIKFENMHAALNSLDKHLTMLLGRLIRVIMYKSQYKARPGYAITVVCTGAYSEIEIFETFKSCGKIGYIWTRNMRGTETCVIDYEEQKSAQAALRITYLHNGYRCKATPFAPNSKPLSKDLHN